MMLTITELLIDNASVPSGGPFIVLLHAGGPFIFCPLVDNASVTAGGPSIFCSTLLGPVQTTQKLSEKISENHQEPFAFR